MAARVQGVSAGTAAAATTLTATLPAAPTRGNALLAIVCVNSTADVSATITGWSVLRSILNSSISVYVFYRVAQAGDAAGVTVNWTGSGEASLTVEEYKDVWGFFDPAVLAVASGNGTAPAVTGGQMGVAAEALVCLIGWNSATGISAPGGGFATENTSASATPSAASSAALDKITTAIEAPAPSATLGAIRDWVAVVVGLWPGAPVGPTRHQFRPDAPPAMFFREYRDPTPASAAAITSLVLSAAGAGLATAVNAPATIRAVSGVGSAIYVKVPAKILAMSGAGSAVLIRAPGKVLATVGAGTATLVRLPGRVLAAVGAGVATVIRLPGKVLAATGVGTTSAVRTASRILAVAGAGVATVIRAPARILTTVGAGTTTLLRTFGRTLSASGVGAATLVRAPAIIRLAVGAGVVVTVNAPSKLISAVGAGSATIIRLPGKVLSVAGIGSALMVRTAARVLSVSGAGVAVVVRVPGRVLSVSGAGTASLLRTFGRTLTSSGAGTASIIRQPGKVLAAVGAGAVTVVRLSSKPLAAVGSGTATIIRAPARILSVSGAGMATIITAKVKVIVLACTGVGSAVIVRMPTKIISVAGAGTAVLVRLPSKTLNVAGTGAATIIRSVSRTLSVSGSGLATITRQTARTLSVTGTGAATLVRIPAKILSSVGSGTATIVRMPARVITSSGAGIATIIKAVTKVLAVPVYDPLVGSGNEITDVVRTANTQGDGRTSPDSSFGIWGQTTNLCTNGGFETDLNGWGAVGGTFSRDTSRSKYGSACLKMVAAGAARNDFSVTLTAGTAYTFSVWVRVDSAIGALFMDMTNFAGDGSATVDLAAPANAALGTFVKGSATFTPAVTGAHVLRVQTNSGGTFYLDGAQLEAITFATPYVETNGATASRAAARVQAPSSLLDRTQCWIAIRMRMGFSSGAPPGDAFPFLWNDGVDAQNDQLSIYQAAGNFQFRSWDATAQDNITVAPAYAADDMKTLILACTASQLKGSVDGAAFTTVTRNHIPRLGIQGANFNIGSSNTGLQCDSTIYWVACGIGTLTDADAATIHGFGNADPSIGQLPDTSRPQMLWPANTLAFTHGPTGSVSGVLRPAKIVATSSAGVAMLRRQPSKVFAAAGAVSAGSVTIVRLPARVLSAVGAGIATSIGVKVKTIILACTGAGTAVIVKLSGRVLAAAGAGVAAVTKSGSRTLSATGVGQATVIRAPLKTLTAIGAGTVTIVRFVGRAFSVTGAGATILIRLASKTLSAIGAGQTSFSRTTSKQFAAVGGSVASIIRLPARTFTAVGVGIATLQVIKMRRLVLLAVGAGVTSLLRTPARVLGAIGNGIASLIQLLQPHRRTFTLTPDTNWLLEAAPGNEWRTTAVSGWTAEAASPAWRLEPISGWTMEPELP